MSEKAMATHSSNLAWKIPGMEEPGGLQSMGSQRVGHDWSNLERLYAQVCDLFTKKKVSGKGFNEPEKIGSL